MTSATTKPRTPRSTVGGKATRGTSRGRSGSIARVVALALIAAVSVAVPADLVSATNAPIDASAPISPSAPPTPGFGDAVSMIFEARCVRCHGADESSGGLRLDGYDAVLRGGERGPAIVAGNPRSSLLFQKVLRRDRPAMPPRKALPGREVRAIRAWIEAGALR